MDVICIATKMRLPESVITIYDMDLASLREQEKKVNKDMDDQLITDTSVKKLTVNGLFERYMATTNIRERTKKNYYRYVESPGAVIHWEIFVW